MSKVKKTIKKKKKRKKPDNAGEIRNNKGQFKPGVSGNLDGKPPGAISITAAIKAKLKTIPKGKKVTYLELLILKIFDKAITQGDQTMLRSIWNYIDGMPIQKISGDPTNPLTIIFDESFKKKK